MISSNTAVLLLAHGSPDFPDEVPEFLRHVTGRALPEETVREITRRYRLIGPSPLTEITRKQAEALGKKLGLPVFVGMRNWKPFIGEAVAQARAAGVQRAVALCMTPHNSRTSVGLYRQAVEQHKGELALAFVESWHDHPLLAQAFADRLRAGWTRACAGHRAAMPVIFTAHSVPERTIAEGDPYEQQARETAELVAARVPELPREMRHFAFQSQGASGGKWIGPTVEETIERLKSQGHGAVFVQPIGFLCDHVEILYDVDIAFRDFAAARGMKLLRAKSLNDSPLLTDALADIVRGRLGVISGDQRLTTNGQRPPL